MNKAKYKITIAEAATKGARLDHGGATARAWCVIRIDTTTGDKVTAAQIIVGSANNVAGDKNLARAVKRMSNNWGGVYTRRTAAIVAAYKAVADMSVIDDCYLDSHLDVSKANAAEAEYIKAAADRKEAARQRRLERMTPDERKAAEDRAAIRAVKARAAEEIAAIKSKTAA